MATRLRCAHAVVTLLLLFTYCTYLMAAIICTWRHIDMLHGGSLPGGYIHSLTQSHGGSDMPCTNALCTRTCCVWSASV